MGKTDSSCIKMYKKTPHSCLSLNWFQRYGMKYYRMLMQNQVEIPFDSKLVFTT